MITNREGNKMVSCPRLGNKVDLKHIHRGNFWRQRNSHCSSQSNLEHDGIRVITRSLYNFHCLHKTKIDVFDKLKIISNDKWATG